MNHRQKQQNREPDYFSSQISAARRFYRNLHPTRSETVSVVAGGRESCTVGYEIHRSTFPYYAIEFVAGGRGVLTLKGREYDLLPGTIFTYGNNVPHAIRNSEQEPLQKYFINFTGRRGGELLVRHSLRAVVLHTSAPNLVADGFDELIDRGFTDNALNEQLCSLLMEILILKIAETALPFGESMSPAFATYQRCREYIHGHYQELDSLGAIAKACCIDQAYLCRLFKRFGHQTPYQSLLRLRMNRAAELLLTPGKLAKEVAHEMGFEDQFHFSRTFKKTFGLSPKFFTGMRWK
jgi:AraC-like DNA-binding protein/mannose-6-phosphate isomerase-like protein (cupin superfamily)